MWVCTLWPTVCADGAGEYREEEIDSIIVPTRFEGSPHGEKRLGNRMPDIRSCLDGKQAVLNISVPRGLCSYFRTTAKATVVSYEERGIRKTSTVACERAPLASNKNESEEGELPDPK